MVRPMRFRKSPRRRACLHEGVQPRYSWQQDEVADAVRTPIAPAPSPSNPRPRRSAERQRASRSRGRAGCGDARPARRSRTRSRSLRSPPVARLVCWSQDKLRPAQAAIHFFCECLTLHSRCARLIARGCPGWPKQN